ncbi:MAG: putative lipid II flippase FtsW [Dehalococcoidia bacterium]|nr:putative lipid II flippase FtsW [Dehalococcoidia bacterium]
MSAFAIAVGAGIVLMLMGTIAKAFALPIASSLLRAWVWLVTLGLPAEVKNARRTEIAGDLYEHQQDARAAGYAPDAIGIHILLRFLISIPGDVTWRLGQLGIGYVLLPAAAVLIAGGLVVTYNAGLVHAVRVLLGVAVLALLITVVGLRRLLLGVPRGAVWLRGHASPDYILIWATAALLVVGLLTVYSASFAVAKLEYGDTNYFIARQAAFALVGLVLLCLFMRLDYHLLQPLSIGMMAIALVGLLAVLLPGVGIERDGASRWLALGPLPPIQPSEFAKLAIIVYISAWLASRSHGDGIKHFWAGFLPFVLMVGLVASLVIVEPDMGTTIIIVLTTCTLFFVAGAAYRHLFALILGGELISWAIIFLAHYRLERIFSFLEPGQDPQGSGFQVLQLLRVLGSGGGTGLGWQAGRDYVAVPGAHTAGVFAVIGQQLGFVGVALVIALFALFVYRGVRTAFNAPDRFGVYLAVGIVGWIAYQTLINIGGVTRSIPLTGVPLPFISYGGSSLMATLAGVGVLLSISRRASVAIRRPSVSRAVS